MYKRILVPLDTSKLAEIALPYAVEFAMKLGSEAILLHVRTSADAPDKIDHKTYMSKIAADMEKQIKKSPALAKGEKVKVESVVYGFPSRINDPAGEILDYADKEKISMIIMATHGTTGMRRWALGSTANKVARASRCPILLIRAGAAIPQKVSLDKILVPLDGSQPSEAVLPYIEALASRLKSHVSLLNIVERLYHIYPYSDALGYYSAAGVIRVPYTDEELKPMKLVAEKYITDVSDKLSTQGVKTGYEVKTGDPAEEIIKAEGEMHPDLVAMSTHGHSGFGRSDHGSGADKVLHRGSTPLLLVRPY